MYLDAEVQDYLARLANAKGVDFSTLVNAMLRKDLELIDIARRQMHESTTRHRGL